MKPSAVLVCLIAYPSAHEKTAACKLPFLLKTELREEDQTARSVSESPSY